MDAKTGDTSIAPNVTPKTEPAFVQELEKPIQAHGETVKTLTFREPTARDLLQIGNPVIFNMFATPPIVTHEMTTMTAMLSRLGNVPPSSIEQMTTRDLIDCSWGITRFFVPHPGKI
jgi:hypothetical protein